MRQHPVEVLEGCVHGGQVADEVLLGFGPVLVPARLRKHIAHVTSNRKRLLLAIHEPLQHAEGGSADTGVVAVDGCDARRGLEAGLSVVKTGNHDFLGYADAVGLQRLLDAHGQIVVAAEDHVRQVAGLLKHCAGSLAAGVHLPIRLIEARVGNTQLGAGMPPSARPGLSLPRGGKPIHKGRSRAPGVREHAAHQPAHSCVVVGSHTVGMSELVVDRDHRFAQRMDLVGHPLAQRRRPRAVALNDEAVIALVVAEGEHLEGALLGLVVGILSKRIEDHKLYVVACAKKVLHPLVIGRHDFKVPVE